MSSVIVFLIKKIKTLWKLFYFIRPFMMIDTKIASGVTLRYIWILVYS